MGYFPRLLECRRQRFLVCGVIFGLFCVAWIYINVQGQTTIENVSGDVKPSFLGHHGVSENERRIWRKKFFAGVKKILGQFKENRSYPREGHENDTKLSELKRIRSHPRKSFEVAAHNGLFHFFEPGSCDAISPEMVLYNRIFKTGSETVGTLFQFVATVMDYDYAKRTTEDFYDEGISDPYPMIIERAARAIGNNIFYNAHFYFRDNLKIQRTHTYINQVREPVSRYISHNSYMHNTRHRPAWRINKMIRNGELNETIQHCFEREGQGCKKNLMTRFFCGPEKFCKNDGRNALKRAKENILKHYAVVGLLEHFHLTLKVLQRRLPYFLPVFPRNSDVKMNQAVKRSSNFVSEEMMLRIKQANWADVELYDFVKQLFWRQVKACGVS